jgi:hypothetical protein
MMKKIIEWIKTNKASSALVALAASVLITAAVMQGCTLGTMIKHDVPPAMRSFNDGKPKVSLNDAPFVLEAYLDDTERNVSSFVAANEVAHKVRDVIASLTTIGLEELGNAPFPGAALVSGVLMGFAGLMTRKPGTAKEIAEQKMASYNKADEAWRKQLDGILNEQQLRGIVEEIKKGLA